MKRTPLYECHLKAGAQIVPFAGYDMPVRYSGDKIEHMAVREKAGLFDVSHMGEVWLRGKNAAKAADVLLTNDISAAPMGSAVYALMLNEQGGIVDDVIAYKIAQDAILICVNASNVEKDFNHIQRVVHEHVPDVEAANESEQYAQIALQGPKSRDILLRFTDQAASLNRFSIVQVDLKLPEGPVPVLLACTGYTGEDGFEIYLSPKDAPRVWTALLDQGQVHGLLACGLGARDTLRLEAGMCLYGNDIDESTTPLEAGLGFFVKWNKPTPFYGLPALLAQKGHTRRKLVGLRLTDRNIARHGYSVKDAQGLNIGVVTSGTLAPFLNQPIAMAYIDKPHDATGSEVWVDIRGKACKAIVAQLPFYKRAKEGA